MRLKKVSIHTKSGAGMYNIKVANGKGEESEEMGKGELDKTIELTDEHISQVSVIVN